MKILEYKYKIRLTMMTDGSEIEYSLENFLLDFGIYGADAEEFGNYKFDLINRESKKVIYSDLLKDGDRPPYYIVSRLLDGIPEERAIPKKTITTLGELLKSKQITLSLKDSHEGE